MNRVVEVARLPLPEQPAYWADLNAEMDQHLSNPNQTAREILDKAAYLLIPDFNGAWRANHGAKSRLGAAVVALACERFRLEHGDWPDHPDQLTPYLPDGTIPIDPYTGRPLRFSRVEGGLVAYGLGPDLSDDGGLLHDEHRDLPGFDLGFRLWDPDLRHQPPEDLPDEDSPTGRLPIAAEEEDS